MTWTIRCAETTNVDAIFDVRTSVTENILDRAQLTRMGITTDSIAQMIRHAPCAWVAVDAGTVVGFSMIDLSAGSLFAAFVLPAHQGRGIGKALVQAAESALFHRHEVVWLETGKTTRAAEFYRSLGWGNATDITDRDIRLEKPRP